jgi:hypothetical protein
MMGVEFNDLKRLVEPKISIDKFKSKMGEDKDIVVVCFTILGKDPAMDLVNFIEKSYDWVLDADLSSSDMTNGNYNVFVELERNKKTIHSIYSMVNDILNLTGQTLSEWTFLYYKNDKEYPFTKRNLFKLVIDDPEQYDREMNEHNLDKLRSAAGVKVNPKKVDDELHKIQVAAGIK